MDAPSDTASETHDAELRALVAAHQGNRSAIARALSTSGRTITRQGVTARLRKSGLLQEADDLRARGRQPGPRVHVSRDEMKAERERILDALARSPNYDAAVPLLDMAVATMYRKIASHRITPEEVARRRRKLDREAKRAASGR